ncbi:hypothetical protein THRCLA_21801 [Thraustotheca clavata]|uniref:EF-hand domain-containing protein n=1 Tax=Thraustotheca clavata TaxID=74557 RepID=A0A1V9ZNT8_9STRA|nr:hypothetical protein THRCLA_21801 [Thraustotheca clavata]
MYKQLLKRNQYLESLVVTQEKDLLDMEMAKTESNQTMQLIRDELSRVHKLVVSQCEVNQQKESPETRPAWAVMAVKSMVYRFDLDGDYLLSVGEMNNLKKTLGHTTLYTDDTFQALITRYCFDSQPCLPSNSNNNRVAVGLTPEGVMQLYETLGLESLEQDLKALGIYIGRTDDCTISEVRDIISDLEVNFKACNESRATLRAEVDEKARAVGRLRENLVEATAQVVQHREECNVAINSTKRLHDEMEALQEKHENYVHSNVVSKAEMVGSQDAVVEMRSLLEAQISETEMWQRHCWELQEQLSAIMESCSAHKKDLWKAKDAKKAEERKNMLLYMQLQHGKKHVQVEH